MSPLTIIKIILSIPIGIGLAYPFLYPARGILDEMKLLGTLGSVLVVVAFFLLVFFYARDLRDSLRLVSQSSRKAAPNSVWLMFLLPYNFIEDFFIVASVAKSLKAEAKTNPALASFQSFGMISGLGWCAAQIVSLVPNQLGSVAGLLAMLLWIWHWIFIRRANKSLKLAKTGFKAGIG